MSSEREKLLLRTPRAAAAAAAAAMHHSAAAVRPPASQPPGTASEFTFTASATYAAADAWRPRRSAYDHHAARGAGAGAAWLEGEISGLCARKRVPSLSLTG